MEDLKNSKFNKEIAKIMRDREFFAQKKALNFMEVF